MVPLMPSCDTSQKRPAGAAGSAGKTILENDPLNDPASNNLNVSPSASGLPLAVTRRTPPNVTEDATTKSLLRPESLLAISMIVEPPQNARQPPRNKLLLIVSLPMDKPGARVPPAWIATESLITPSPANVPLGPSTSSDPLPDPNEPRTASVPSVTMVPPR